MPRHTRLRGTMAYGLEGSTGPRPGEGSRELSQLVVALNQLGDFADRAASTVLMASGMGLLAFAFVMKFQVWHTQLANFRPGEFIATVGVAGVLILVGGWLRVYATKLERPVREQLVSEGIELAKGDQEIAKLSIEKGAPPRATHGGI